MEEEKIVLNPGLCDSKLFPWWLLLVWGILTVLIGCMFLTTPRLTAELLVTFMGAWWFIGGLFAVGSLAIDRTNMGWKIFFAVINIFAGLLILLYPLFSTLFIFTFFVIFIGFWAIFVGVSHVYHAFREKDAGNGVLGIISIIFGLLLLIYPFIVVELLPFVAGGFAIVFGIVTIFVSSEARKCQVPATP